MRTDKHFDNRAEVLAVLAGILMFALFLAFGFGYYYDLNDDMLMKDITSGMYTGNPEGRNIQMLFPLSWFLSLFYRVFRTVNWYGLFFLIAHFGCFFLLAKRSLQYFEAWWSKGAALLAEGVFVCAFFLYELVFVQYTVTAALLAATAAFLLYTTEETSAWQTFFKKNILSIVLVIVAFQLREEMLLLVFPLLCVVGICKWSNEEKIFCKDSFCKYGSVIAAILIGLLLSLLVDAAAYGNTQWKQFRSFFDSRTDIYDFYGIPPYKENQAFYESIGMKQSEQMLLENYNFGLSEHINAQAMEEIAEYAKTIQTEKPFLTRVKESAEDYRYEVLADASNLSWHNFIVLMYFFVFVLAVGARQIGFVWKIPLLFSVRSVLWLYLLFRGRLLNRVSHPLFFVEFVILAAILLDLYVKIKKKNGVHRGIRYAAGAMSLFLLFLSLQTLPASISAAAAERDKRNAVNAQYEALQTYCREHTDNFYFLDIYSTVAYSENIALQTEHRLKNYDYPGGWACKSPLQQKKLAAFGMQSIEEAVLNRQDVFVVAKPERAITWLEQYFADVGKDVTAKQTDVIIENETEAFYVYRVVLGG